MKNYNTILNENVEWAKGVFAKIDKKMSAVTLRSRDKVVDGVDENGRFGQNERKDRHTLKGGGERQENAGNMRYPFGNTCREGGFAL